MNSKKLFLLFFLAFFITGCATWHKTSGNYINSPEKYSVDLPWGWMQHKGKELILTKDGIWLESIIIARHNIEEKLQYTKKKFVKGMFPEEISQIILDDLKANGKIGNLEVIENVPVTISGVNGFKLAYSFTTEEGLKKKCIHYGFGHADWVYEISYTATDWHYFDKGFDDFNKLVNSFKFLG